MDTDTTDSLAFIMEPALCIGTDFQYYSMPKSPKERYLNHLMRIGRRNEAEGCRMYPKRKNERKYDARLLRKPFPDYTVLN